MTQSTLFDAAPIRSGSAIFGGPGGCYRYVLTRRWQADGTACCFVMLNPSTADAVTPDATIRRCIGYAQRWGFDALAVVNLYALRSTDPAGLWTHPDPIGPENDRLLLKTAREASLVVCAWGEHGLKHYRGAMVRAQLHAAGIVPHCLTRTSGGAPGHPLRLRNDLVPLVMED